MEKITTNPAAVRVAQAFCAVKDARAYTKGIHIQTYSAGGIVLTATDGRKLIQVHDANGECSSPVILELTKPALSALIRAKTASFEHLDGLDWVLVTETQRHTIKAIDATYPDVSYVLPAEPPKISCLAKTLDARLLLSISVASAIIWGKNMRQDVTFWPNEPGSAMYAEFGDTEQGLQCKVVICALSSSAQDCTCAVKPELAAKAA